MDNKTVADTAEKTLLAEGTINETTHEEEPRLPLEQENENPSTVSEDASDAFVDANLALMRELDALADALQSLPVGFKEKMDNHREKLAHKLETRLKSVKDGMQRAPFIKTRDKFSFVAGNSSPSRLVRSFCRFRFRSLPALAGVFACIC
jgi:hypothetical protein